MEDVFLVAKKQRLTLEELLGDAQSVFKVLSEETDIAVALIGASYIDAALGGVLSQRFRESKISSKLLNPLGGRLGEISVRADVAYVLDLINESTHQDVLIIAQVRNKFAHKHNQISFSTAEIIELCNKLRFADSFIQAISGGDPASAPIMHSARTRFSISVATLSQRILAAGVAESSRRAIATERSADSKE